MVRVFHFAALVLLAAWLPATAHCELESVLNWSTEQCDHHETSDVGDRSTVEDGNYRSVETGTIVIAPVAIALPWIHAITTALAPDDQPGISGWIEQPPELARRWQFIARTALPGNAPSFVS
jgi:hypothetical protein